MAERSALRVAIIGSGNIGTDLMLKIERSPALELVGVAGIDPDSAGLARAAAARPRDLARRPRGRCSSEVDEVDLVFDATSAARPRRARRDARRARASARVDLTPAALGPAVIPPVNLESTSTRADVNLVTCGAQATVPIVAAISRRPPVSYAEIVSTISARSAGPGTRAEHRRVHPFDRARALETVGGAERGKAIILLNPAEPPILMRNTVFADVGDADLERDRRRRRARWSTRSPPTCPGYRLTRDPARRPGTPSSRSCSR